MKTLELKELGLSELKMEEIAPKALWFNVFLLVAFAVAYHFFNEPLSFHFSLWGILLFLIGYLLLIAQIERIRSTGDKIGKAFFLKLTMNGRAHHAPVACNINFS